MGHKEKLWFKRKRYGYGWTPSSWQGWVVIAVFLIVIIGGALTLEETPENTFTKELGFYLMVVFICAVMLLRISYKKGPTPKWRWGSKSNDDSEEDF